MAMRIPTGLAFLPIDRQGVVRRTHCDFYAPSPFQSADHGRSERVNDGKPMKRKLTTIFCADVQRYSTLMAGDEAGTLARLQRYRSIMNDLFERHEGRKVNTWGDAVIAEFGSVVEAVRCAVEIQDAIGAENRDLPESRQMWFRIGINLGSGSPPATLPHPRADADNLVNLCNALFSLPHNFISHPRTKTFTLPAFSATLTDA
ncbi:adenylate/guanylate cyclase domain-containing protein [Mesorhizobium sp. ZMM04-4]